MSSSTLVTLELGFILIVDIVAFLDARRHWGDRQYPYKRKQPR